jgi:predicted AAA+ superfamily ATPase
MLYLFNNIKKPEILDAVLNLKNDSIKAINKLIDFGISKGLDGNIWKKYIIYILIYNDNSYTRAIEKGLDTDGQTSYLDLDLRYFYDLYHMKQDELGEAINFNFKSKSKDRYLTSAINYIYERITDDSFDTFKKAILDFYKNVGLADMAVYKAFRVADGVLKPIKNVLDVSFDDLIGYEYQKNLLKENTINFIEGKPYNNVLLYGESGTGKSTSIKALLNEYFDKGLRIIEVYKHQMEEISKIINKLKNRPYHFIIYMDDLSFEEDEVEYKYLKSIIEGGIEPKPENVSIYATSNRRHLIKETMADNGGIFDDLHRSETQAEKLSLAYRFGLQIYYSSLNPAQFKEMVLELAKIHKIKMEEELLLKEASKWELTYGSLSGRCATQFVNYIINKENNK